MVDRHATQGNPKAFAFAEPNMAEIKYSFSGLKNAILYFLQAQQKNNEHFIQENLADLCASIQHTIIKILMKKLVLAAQQTGIRDICIAGGVSANRGLRTALTEYGTRYRWNTFIPKFEYCTDNAAMIGITAWYKYLAGEFADLSEVATARNEAYR